MAKQTAGHVVRTFHSAARTDLGLIVPPFILMGAIVWALSYARRELAEAGNDVAFLDWRWYAIPIVFLLLLPLWARFKARFFSGYAVTLDSVVEEHGFFGKTTSEVRIQDIRNIVVRRSFLDRLLATGDVSFSSSAGDGIEVRFGRVSRPTRIKELVRDIQGRLANGRLTQTDIDEITAKAWGRAVQPHSPAASDPPSPEPARLETAAARTAAAPAPKPAPAPPKAAAPASTVAAKPASTPKPAPTDASDAGGDARDELYRLLAEQEAEGKSDG